MIRKYDTKDKAELIELLRLNTPEFFHPSEEKDYVRYLENSSSENYFVIEENSDIVGAGGINYGFDDGKTARISWDIIRPEKQKQGIGSQLVQYRIHEIKKNPNITKIIVRTTQLAYGFYERFGFQLEFVENNYWAKGIDLYQMKLVVI